jgi:hypothetical protein
MEEVTREQVLPRVRPDPYRAGVWQIPWFLFHLAIVYFIAKFVTLWLAAWIGGTLLPLLQNRTLLQPRTFSGRFEFLFSHMLAFSFIPAFLSSLVNTRLRHKTAQFVWLVPAVILAYKFASFSAPSVLQSQFSAAFNHYFGGGFLIPDFHDWHEFFSILGSSSDMTRGMAQLQFTAPFYAGVGYSVAAWIARRLELSRVAEKVEQLT